MSAISQAPCGHSVPQPRQPIVTDHGGLVVGRIFRPTVTAGTTAVSAAGPGVAAGGREAGVELTPADLATVVSTAARAPSVHNTQPWRFRISGNVIELHADPGRTLTQIDPVGRELMISCGAALFGLRLGLRQFGYVPAVQLWPDPAQPWLIARAWPEARAALNSVEAELLAAVPHRHTHRGPFTPGDVSPRLLDALAVDAVAEGSELLLIEQPELVSALAELVDAASAQQEASAEIRAETSDWVRPAGSLARDGVPARAARGAGRPAAGGPDSGGPGASGPAAGEAGAGEAGAGEAGAGEAGARRFRQRDFGPEVAGEDAGEPPAVTAVLFTPADTADDWLRAGQALNRLLLRAATRWVFASLHSQPLESPTCRQQVRDLLALPGQPQMLLQLGRANTAPATPRRPQAEFGTNEKGA